MKKKIFVIASACMLLLPLSHPVLATTGDEQNDETTTTNDDDATNEPTTETTTEGTSPDEGTEGEAEGTEAIEDISLEEHKEALEIKLDEVKDELLKIEEGIYGNTLELVEIKEELRKDGETTATEEEEKENEKTSVLEELEKLNNYVRFLLVAAGVLLIYRIIWYALRPMLS